MMLGKVAETFLLLRQRSTCARHQHRGIPPKRGRFRTAGEKQNQRVGLKTFEGWDGQWQSGSA